ncbi:phage tail tape measure protein [Saccharopolyspora sp. 6T]|uniref:phage tail tape measure protein n=1 Tax=Saccharopolyspora sp. 6T TaxID=2877238 RepID=UPI001CD1BB25|nr:phage tail tape measure protein [Saccharopolyspora sp. 6T]MCA1185703.1 phage tail tape measure protein [Saccharopolyspora sp. 6T]
MGGGAIDILVEPDLRTFPQKLGAGLEQAGRGVSGVASKLGRTLSLGLVAGTAAAAAGLKQVVDLGVQYETSLNTLQAVTNATGEEMSRVKDRARELGSDLTLPATSAATATEAMLELAKGGLTLDEAMTAARGTIQLAAAAQIDAGKAAEIQSAALNQFGLAAEDASHVADVLANTANAAAGEITDIGYSLKYVGPVARSLGIDIDQAAAAIGLMANQGIVGEQAGTSLRGVLASLSAPSKQAARAMEELGLVAFDQQGKFVGLRTITEQLADAKGRMTDEEFQSAAATAFGNEGMTVANALANSGADAFDRMTAAVGRQGGAAEVANAKMQGLGGALEKVQSQAEDIGIGIYEVISGPLTMLATAAAGALQDWEGAIVGGLQAAVDTATEYGPRIVDAATSSDLWQDGREMVGNFAGAIRELAPGLADVARDMLSAGGAAGILAGAVELSGDAFSVVTSLLGPISALLGGLVNAFADLPAPIQTAVIAMGLMGAFRPQIAAFGDTVRERLVAPFRAFGEEMRLQQALLTGSTQIMATGIGRVGLAMAALEARIPAVGRMAEAYRTASTAAEGWVREQVRMSQLSAAIGGQVTGLTTALGRAEGGLSRMAGAAAGTAAALGSGLRSAVGGLVGALGGPWGLAIGAAVVGLGFLADSQAKAKQRAEEHKQQVQTLAQALRENNGVLTESIQAQRLLDAQQQSLEGTNGNLLQGYKQLSIDQGVWTRALLGEQDSIDSVNRAYDRLVERHTMTERNPYTGGTSKERLDQEGLAAARARDQFRAFSGQVNEAEQANRALAAALGTANPTVLTATESGKNFAEAMGVLSDNTSDADQKVRALDQALGALSGEALTTEQAEANLHAATDGVRQAMEDAGQATGGNLSSLVSLDGAINTSTETGRRFREAVLQQRQSMADMALSARDAALAAGKDLPAANESARVAAQKARDEFMRQAVQMGLTRDQADQLAYHYGLIPDNVITAISQPGMSAAQQEAVILKARVDAVPDHKTTVTYAVTEDARRKLNELGYTVNTFPDGRTVITADTAGAQAQLNGFVDRNAGRRIQMLIDYVVSTPPKPSGGPFFFNERGGLLKAFAAGGINLTPMRGGVADIVPPNTWRVVGDRMRDDEAYIPINRSSRSTALLEETARRMGYQLLRRYADGGIAARASAPGPAAPGPQVSTVSPAAIRAALAGMSFQINQHGLVEMLNKENLRRRGR